MNERDQLLTGLRSGVCVLAFGVGSILTAATSEDLDWSRIPGAARSARFREAQLRFELEKATPAAIQERIRTILAAPRSAATARHYLAAVEWLARKQGELALTFAQENLFAPLSPRALSDALVRGWAASDPDATEAWLRSEAANINDDEAESLVRVLLQVDALPDGRRAVQRAQRLVGTGDQTRSRFQNYALVVIEALVHAGKFAEAHALVAELEPRETRETVGAELVALSAEHRPELATRWFRDLPRGLDRRGALFRLLETLASGRFSAAVSFYLSLESQEHSFDLAETLLVNACAFTPDDLKRVIETVSAADRDRLIGVALTRINSLQPDAVPWDWLADVRDSDRRMSTLERLLATRGDSAVVGQILDRLKFLSVAERAALRERHSVEKKTADHP